MIMMIILIMYVRMCNAIGPAKSDAAPAAHA